MGFLASAITLAGFSGIITAIDRSVAPASSEVIAFRVHNLVVTAIYLTTLALLPVIIDALDVLPQTRWQFCTMIAAITVGWGISSAVSARMRMTSHTSRGISNFLQRDRRGRCGGVCGHPSTECGRITNNLSLLSKIPIDNAGEVTVELRAEETTL